MTAREINLDNYERRYSELVKEHIEPELDPLDYPVMIVTNCLGEPTNEIYIVTPFVYEQDYALCTYYRKKEST